MHRVIQYYVNLACVAFFQHILDYKPYMAEKFVLLIHCRLLIVTYFE